MSEKASNKWKWIQPISKEIFKMKYKFHRNSLEDVFSDVAKVVSSTEKGNNKFKYGKEFYDMMTSGEFIPAGRILANAWPDSPVKNYMNCFTISIDDSMENIYDSLKEDAMISKVGGGVGFDLSNIRPKNADLSVGGVASGPLSFVKVFDASAKVIMTGGSRRCLPKTYKVQMFDKSWKQIDEIEIGDKINFEDKSYSVSNFFDNGIQDLVKIKTKNGYHISTPNHKWYVMNLETNKPEWIDAKDLYSGKIKFGFLVPKNE